MNLGFSSIIADGLRKGQQEQSNAFARLGQGAADLAGGITQFRYSKGNKDLFTQKMELEQQRRDGAISEHEYAQKIDGLENMIRDHNMNYYNRGARVALTPQDYERRDAAEMAALKAEQDRIMQAYEKASMNERMYHGKANEILINVPDNAEAKEVRKFYVDQANALGAQANQLGLIGKSQGLGGHLFLDRNIGNPGTEETVYDSASGKKKYDLAKEYFNGIDWDNGGYVDPTAFSEFINDKGMNPNSKEASEIYNIVEKKNEAYLKNQKLKNEAEDRNTAKTRDAENHKLAIEKAKREAEADKREKEKAIELHRQQVQFVSNKANATYSPDNAMRMANLFKDYKSDQIINGKSITGIVADWANGLINKDAIEREYKIIFDIYSKMLTNENPPAAGTISKGEFDK